MRYKPLYVASYRKTAASTWPLPSSLLKPSHCSLFFLTHYSLSFLRLTFCFSSPSVFFFLSNSGQPPSLGGYRFHFSTPYALAHRHFLSLSYLLNFHISNSHTLYIYMILAAASSLNNQNFWILDLSFDYSFMFSCLFLSTFLLFSDYFSFCYIC